MMPVKALHHGGALAEAIVRYGGKADDWLDLSTGIAPFAVIEPDLDTECWRRLPDPSDCADVARMASGFYADGACLPAVVPGSQAAIQHLPALAKGQTVAILGPTYGEYAESFRRAGRDVRSVSSLADARGADAVVVVNPNNPDGRILDRETLLAFARARQGRLTIVDEAFADMMPGHSVASAAGDLDGLVVLRSFGKFFGMAGLRLGFVFGAEGITDHLSSRLGPWAVSGPALAIARQVFSTPAVIEQQRQQIEAAHRLTGDAIERSGFERAGTNALFFLVRAGSGEGLKDRLAKRAILVRSFDHTPDCVRIGLVRDATAAGRLYQALRDCRADLAA